MPQRDTKAQASADMWLIPLALVLCLTIWWLFLRWPGFLEIDRGFCVEPRGQFLCRRCVWFACFRQTRSELG